MPEYEHGVWWISLSTLQGPELVLASVAQVVGAKQDLAAHIGDRTMLLLLDNFEHVVEAAADVSVLLGACPNLRCLVTSREPLHVGGEQVYVVPPLAEEEAVLLFGQRASPELEDEGEAVVAEICRRLDCLPLAVELAAARSNVLSPTRLFERLEERLPLLTSGARDAQGAPSHAQGDDRVEPRPARCRGATAVRGPLGLRRGRDARPTALRVPAAEDIHLTTEYIQWHIVGVSTQPTQMGTCLVPLVPDNGYVLDFAPPAMPSRENVVVATAGWAFKFAPMFGKIMAELAIKGESTQDIGPMSITRPGVLVDLYPGEGSPAAPATPKREVSAH